jgi:hypothetical protein
MNALEIIAGLNEPEALPIEAIRAAQANRDSMVPIFLRNIEELWSPDGTPIARSALFFVFHLLGEWREKSAYRPLAKLLRLPSGEIDAVLGGAITETTHRVMASVFDGDPNPLYEIILDKDADEFIRSRMCQAIAILARRGDLPRAEAVRFLHACYSRLEPQHDCFVWSGWLDAVAWLGLADLTPLVQQAFARGSIDPTWLKYEDFETDLHHAVGHPGAEPLHPDGDLTLFGDTIAELSDWYCFKPEARPHQQDERAPPAPLYLPERNPFRKVRRNDPCPCGSGKKFKKCCLTSDLDTAPASNFLKAG